MSPHKGLFNGGTFYAGVTLVGFIEYWGWWECICGLAAAVTDLLQSVQLEYHGYEGDTKNDDTKKGASEQQVKERLNGLFSLVQGLGGTAVVRTYIDQLAQVLSALVGWSRIETCDKSNGKCGGDEKPHGQESCKYLGDVTRDDRSCDTCGCMKWDVAVADDDKNGHHLGRGCTRCSGGGSDCTCKDGEDQCAVGTECKCAKAGKCCKCYCKDECKAKCKEECRCDKHSYIMRYRSTYTMELIDAKYWTEIKPIEKPPTWADLLDRGNGKTPSKRRHQCARILLGSVCLIWSGITYMYWTGKYHSSSPRWNNHILDGSGLDDGTLSQWLQALGFPRDMLNNSGPRNRWDAVIWDGIRGMLYLGFPETGNGSPVHGGDYNDNTFRQPAGMNFAGYIHTVDRGAFCSKANLFSKNGDDASITDEQMHKCGALYKLYILSCAYFTGLQKRNSESTPRTPKTIREILYWLSALPYSQAYPKILEHSKEVLKKVAPEKDGTKTLSFLQTGRTAPITVHEFNLFAHFQAVTQYCPLVLIGIQGGIHSTDKTLEPAIHALYANTECRFTYPTVSIQAYNQVVHYIRALFYQLYFLRKQCAVKVALGGKWRECRYGSGVLGKDVVSWMCLGCSPMEHDRKSRVKEMNKSLVGVKPGDVAEKVKSLLEAIGEVVVQLGNAQEALEGRKTDGIKAVQEALKGAKGALERAKGELEGAKNGLDTKLDEAKTKLGELTNGGNGGSGILKDVETKLETATGGEDFDQGKNKISEVIRKVHEALDELRKGVEGLKKEKVNEAAECIKVEAEDGSSIIEAANEVEREYTTLLDAIEKLISICNSPKCPGCTKHSDKCGQPSKPTVCPACLQPTTTGVPSPLQAFLEDRLPGFSCKEIPEDDKPDYPLAASHLEHCGGSGQCCPLPMGFRGQFQGGSTSDMTGQRLYGILYFFSNENMMQSCVYTLVRVTAALSATTPQVLGDVFGFFRGGVGEKERGMTKKSGEQPCGHTGDPSKKQDTEYFCGWCASGLRDEVKQIEWIQTVMGGKDYRETVGNALIEIKGDKGTVSAYSSAAPQSSNTSLSTLTKDSEYLSPLTGELYTAVSATFGNTYLSWVLYLSDALEGGLQSLASEFQQIECRGCKGQCDPNKCKKGSHGTNGGGQCGCQSIVSCTGVLPVLYRHGFSYGNPFNLEGYQQSGKEQGDYSITEKKDEKKHCHQFLDSLNAVINTKKDATQNQAHPLTELLKQVGKLQYDIRLPWIFVLTLAWLVAVLYLAFGAIWPLDWTHMRSHCRGWFRKGSLSPWEVLMVGKKKGRSIVEYFGGT